MLGPIEDPRTRLDAATWGTMGIGLGGAVAASAAAPGRLVVAVEGDSAFGFSGMECETIARYHTRGSLITSELSSLKACRFTKCHEGMWPDREY